MRIFGWVLAALALAVVAILVLGTTPLGRGPMQSMFAVGDVEKIDFRQVGSMREPARWLACPGFDMCRESDDRTPIYDNDVTQVKRMWDRLLREQEPNMQLVLADDTDHQYTYLVRRAFFQLPDLVTLQIFPQGETRSSVAIYSRSVYPVAEFGANAGRVIRMMDYLDENLSLYKR